MNDPHALLARLRTSAFRSRFRLAGADRAYLARKGLAQVVDHAREIIARRVAPAQPANDGRQTPLRGHPVFVAQHATAACCRTCLAKWHGLPAGQALSAQEQAQVVEVIRLWLLDQPIATPTPSSAQLAFDELWAGSNDQPEPQEQGARDRRREGG